MGNLRCNKFLYKLFKISPQIKIYLKSFLTEFLNLELINF